MSEVKRRIELFKNMISSVSNIYLTTFDPNFELIETTAPNPNILKLIFMIGAGDDPEKMRQSFRFDVPEKYDKVITLITNKLGMAWISEVETTDEQIVAIHILGPVFLNEYQVEELNTELNRLQLSIAVKRIFMDEIKQYPIVSLSRFYEYGIMFHYCITEEKIQISNFTFKVETKKLENYLETGKNYEVNYLTEQKMLALVEQGNLDWRNQFQKIGMPDGWDFKNSIDLLRQAKNTVVMFTTLCSRAAIRGGLSSEVALALSDLYIQKLEEAEDIGSVNKINEEMVEDLVKRVHRVKLAAGVSPQIQRSCDYICAHLDQKLNISELAASLGYTDYYFSKKFKKEVGIGIREYAAQKKMEYAKKLLLDTSLGVNEIAEQLGYVNQSYFGDIFRKATGVSPSEYRAGRGYV